MLAKLAQEIVNITSEVIVHDVLITDKDGMVLGSRDVGKFLLGALRKVKNPCNSGSKQTIERGNHGFRSHWDA
ncbi:sugar diacid recognition domain-containing protein [Peribacillus frigoritolerans]|uniref:sugar diacid recognition domain-containing protein n=1 Tax=Peribacillus frigoritolerans TaxID=450367 RepID=UPI000FDC168E|nr:sugar diacid recognition domain-containing protein [Peribacillus frigoritolerans]AZV62381.1 hypothetical protein DOZ91_18660 [Peribacillus frigoritolerans]USK79952.1 hypothetical protein LHV56_24735 [Peribacillus frigoritolerans]WJE47238.1 sugar diacid recognition domain-containing protein [Peribacillus frigoritolerans]